MGGFFVGEGAGSSQMDSGFNVVTKVADVVQEVLGSGQIPGGPLTLGR